MIYTAKHGDLIENILWGVDGISWDTYTILYHIHIGIHSHVITIISLHVFPA